MWHSLPWSCRITRVSVRVKCISKHSLCDFLRDIEIERLGKKDKEVTGEEERGFNF
jgi:hypothetical protein